VAARLHWGSVDVPLNVRLWIAIELNSEDSFLAFTDDLIVQRHGESWRLLLLQLSANDGTGFDEWDRCDQAWQRRGDLKR